MTNKMKVLLKVKIASKGTPMVILCPSSIIWINMRKSLMAYYSKIYMAEKFSMPLKKELDKILKKLDKKK